MKQRALFILFLCVLAVVCASSLEAATAKLHIDVGLNHFYKNRYFEAYKEFKAALELEPRNAEAHYNLGRVYKAQGFLKEAMIQFQNAVTLRPSYLAAKRELEAIKKSIESDIEAQKKIQGLNAVQQGNFNISPPGFAEKRANELLSEGRKDEAISFLEQAIKERPNDTNLNKTLGFLRFGQNRYIDALEAYLRALRVSPSDPEIPYAIGVIYMKTRAPEQAAQYFENSLKLSPRFLKSVFALGEAYEAQEKTDEAIFQFKRCLEISPNMKEAKEKLSYLAGRQGYNYFSRGAYFYQGGEYEKAVPLLNMAKQYGSLTASQNKQIDEMLSASKYWLDKKEASEKESKTRQAARQSSYINRSISVDDAAKNPSPYIGQAVEWSGEIDFYSTSNGKSVLFVNANPSVNSDYNMNYCFQVVLPQKLPERRSTDGLLTGTSVTAKGRLLKVERLFNENSNSFSSRRQPVIEASEIELVFGKFDQPTTLRFY